MLSEKIGQQWKEYDATQEELNQWLTSTVPAQKTSSDYKYSLVDIDKQLQDNMVFFFLIPPFDSSNTHAEAVSLFCTIFPDVSVSA